MVPLADRSIGNLQQWLIGTYHGVSREQLQVYLDEFVFRHNRRQTLWPLFKPCSVSEPHVDPCPTCRFGAALTVLYRSEQPEPQPIGLC